MIVENQKLYLDNRDIALLYYSWGGMAPHAHEICLYFFNEIYTANPDKIPNQKVDITKFSFKLLNAFSFLVSNLENIRDVSSNLNALLFSLYSFGKLKSFNEVVLKKAFINSVHKHFGRSWKPECGEAWLKLLNYIQKEILTKMEKVTIVDAISWK